MGDHPLDPQQRALNGLAALQHAVEQVPFEVTGLDFDNGGEFINHDVIGWAADRKILFTRSRPYKKNDQATIESKNNHLVPRELTPTFTGRLT